MSVGLAWAVERPAEVDPARLEHAARAALERGGRGDDPIDVVVLGDAALAELHDRFLGDPSPTDVLAFDLGPGGDGPAGEVYVSLDTARRVAQRRGLALERELALYVIHGCLHLCGFDDHEARERERMRRAEAELLAELGYPEDPAPHDEEPVGG